jgi:ferredoxin
MRVTADLERCIGAGQCVLSAPNVFDQTDEGLVDVLVPVPGDGEADAVDQASRHCPSGAIQISRD